MFQEKSQMHAELAIYLNIQNNFLQRNICMVMTI
jgi:hypothetical protein